MTAATLPLGRAVADFPVGARVRVQMTCAHPDGTPMTYLATVIEPDAHQRELIIHPERYVCVLPDEEARRAKAGGVIIWRPSSLTLLERP